MADTETVVIPVTVETPPVEAQIADAAERVVEAADAAVRMAEVQAAETIAENQEDMEWLRTTVKNQALKIEELSSAMTNMQGQLSSIPQALADTAAASVTAAAITAEVVAEETAAEVLEAETMTDTPETPPEIASPTNPEDGGKSEVEKEPARAAPAKRRRYL